MMEAKIAQRAPYGVNVEAGKTYYWCRCGLSAQQPYCDGAHKGSHFTPLPYKAESTGKVYLCGCKRTHASPKCDGAHAKI
jgi:CDGSH-type Zn-finger protein